MEKEKLKTIYDLKLHETLKIRGSLAVERVPGGWNYKYFMGELNRDEVEWTMFNIIFVIVNATKIDIFRHLQVFFRLFSIFM